MMKKIIISLAFALLGQLSFAQSVDIRPPSSGGGVTYTSNDNMVSQFTPSLSLYPLMPYAECKDSRRGNDYIWNTISWQTPYLDDGRKATTSYTVTNPSGNIATGWNAATHNRMLVNYTTAGVDTFYIDTLDISAQRAGEIFTIEFNTQSRTGDADTVLIHFNAIWKTYDSEFLTEWKCPPRARIVMNFQVHFSVEGGSLVEVDDILGSYGHGGGGGGGGNGIDYVVQSSAPTDTTVFWLDSSGDNPTKKIYPLKERFFGQWVDIGFYNIDEDIVLKEQPEEALEYGQSNALGQDTTSINNSTASQFVQTWNGSRWSNGNAFDMTGYSNGIFYWAKNDVMFSQKPKKLMTVAQGGQSITYFSPGGAGWNTLQTEASQSKVTDLKKIFWDQGEADRDGEGVCTGLTGNAADSVYMLYLRALIDTLRGLSYVNDNAQFIAFGLYKPSPTGRDDRDSILSTLNYDNDDRTFYVSSTGLPSIGDDLHFSSEAMDTFGLRAVRNLSAEKEVYPDENISLYKIGDNLLLKYKGLESTVDISSTSQITISNHDNYDFDLSDLSSFSTGSVGNLTTTSWSMKDSIVSLSGTKYFTMSAKALTDSTWSSGTSRVAQLADVPYTSEPVNISYVWNRNSTTSTRSGFVTHLRSGTNAYAFRHYSSTEFQVAAYNSGTATVLNTYTFNSTADTDYNVAIYSDADSFSITINGVLIGADTIPTANRIASGSVGFTAGASSNPTYASRYRNVVVSLAGGNADINFSDQSLVDFDVYGNSVTATLNSTTEGYIPKYQSGEWGFAPDAGGTLSGITTIQDSVIVVGLDTSKQMIVANMAGVFNDSYFLPINFTAGKTYTLHFKNNSDTLHMPLAVKLITEAGESCNVAPIDISNLIISAYTSADTFYITNSTTPLACESGGFLPQYRAVLEYAMQNGIATPSAAQQIVQNRFVDSLITNNLWDDIDVLYVPATNASRGFAEINWKAPGTHTMTQSGTITWASNTGFTGTGSPNYYDMNFNPSTASGINYALNDAGTFTYISATAASVYLGTSVTGNTTSSAANNASQRLNTSNNLSSAVDRTGTGFKATYRTSSTQVYIENGTTEYSRTATSTIIPNGNIRLFNSGTNYGTETLQIVGVGKSLRTKNAALKRAIDYYITNK